MSRIPLYPFPTISFHRGYRYEGEVAMVNAAGTELFKGVDYIDILTTPEHIVFALSEKVGIGHFKLKRNHKNVTIHCDQFANYPLYGKTFRLYRCRQGYAIRIYEPIFDREVLKK